jgi:hypothetical protein
MVKNLNRNIATAPAPDTFSTKFKKHIAKQRAHSQMRPFPIANTFDLPKWSRSLGGGKYGCTKCDYIGGNTRAVGDHWIRNHPEERF